MRKELRPVHDLISCDLCHRTILKGERIETFVGGGDRQQVCELCSLRARRSGWMREEELAAQTPDRERQRPRPSLWTRAVSWAEEQGLWGAPPPDPAEEHPVRASEPPTPARARPAAAPSAGESPLPEPTSAPFEPTIAPAAAEPEAPAPVAGDLEGSDALASPGEEAAPRGREGRSALDDWRRRAAARVEERRQARELQAEREAAEAEGDEDGENAEDAAALARRPSRGPAASGLRDLISGRRREPRGVHAFPSGRWAKIERALELFNGSEHRKTMAGVARTLGEPWVSAAPLEDGPAAREVGITVAWELSWYRFKVDIDDMEPAVALLDRGNELEDLDEPLRAWNVGVEGEGRLALAVEAVS